MNMVTKKAISAFAISLCVFALVATVFATALSIGRSEYPFDSSKGNNPKNLEGESFNILFVITDYAPEIFDDYDPVQLKNAFNKEVAPNKSCTGLSGCRKINAETMAILGFHKETAELTITPISGNTLVSVKNVKTNLETLLGDYGRDFFVEKIRAITGLNLDTYMVFTPCEAQGFLDMFGKVTYTIKCDMKYSDNERGIDINLKSGSQKLNGENAVKMLRFNNYEGKSVTKSETYTGYFKRLIKKIAQDFTYEELCDILLPKFSGTSDFDSEQFYGCVKLLSESDKLELKELELCGQYQQIGSKQIFVLDEDATLEKFNKYRNYK